MKSKKNYLIGVVCLCIIALYWINLKGLSFQTERNNVSSPSIESLEIEQQQGIEVPQSWMEDIDSNNAIHATIDIPESIRENGFRCAKAIKISIQEESIVELLEKYYHPYKGIEDDNVIQYLGEDNMYLYFDKGDMGGVELTSTLRNYISMAYRDGLTVDYNRDSYKIDSDLTEFTMKECDEKIYQLLKVVGVNGDLWIKHWALDFQTMQEEAQELHEDGSITKPDYAWSQKDDCYHCIVSQTCNDVPIIPNYMLSSYADILNSGSHIFTINEEKYLAFYLNNVYDIKYGEDFEQLLSFQDVIDKYKQYSSLTLRDYSTEITDITMRALVVENEKGEYAITPIWIFYGYWQLDDGSSAPYAVIINALTGDRL